MQNWIKFFIAFIAIFCLSILFNEVMAQCPMCRSAVESAMQQEGNTVGLGLNKGILYLLATPYLMITVVGIIWYRNTKKPKAI